LDESLPFINTLLKTYGFETFDKHSLLHQMKPIQDQLAPLVCDTSKRLNGALKNNDKILFEGAQGTLLCIDHGTYPFVTSSSPTAASIPLSAGIPPQALKHVMGIVKAYTTRVGEGAFPTEIFGEKAESIRIAGNEFGTTTGRPRRIGWLDSVALRHANRVNGFSVWALTLLDVLNGVDSLKICTHYTLNGVMIDELPASDEDLRRVEPVYETMQGFSFDNKNIATYEDLPEAAKVYIEKLEALTKVPVGIVSIGPSRDETLVRPEIMGKHFGGACDD